MDNNYLVEDSYLLPIRYDIDRKFSCESHKIHHHVHVSSIIDFEKLDERDQLNSKLVNKLKECMLDAVILKDENSNGEIELDAIFLRNDNSNKNDIIELLKPCKITIYEISLKNGHIIYQGKQYYDQNKNSDCLYLKSLYHSGETQRNNRGQTTFSGKRIHLIHRNVLARNCVTPNKDS